MAALPSSLADMTVVWGQIWGQLIRLIGARGWDAHQRRFVSLSVGENS